MSKVIPTPERIKKAQALIQKARDLPPPADLGWMDFTYAAEVKDILRQARDLLKFIQFMPNVAPEVKGQVENLMNEITTAEKEILHKKQGGENDQ
jgi:hypothetical protein